MYKVSWYIQMPVCEVSLDPDRQRIPSRYEMQIQLSVVGPGAGTAMIESLLALENWEYINSFERPLHFMAMSVLSPVTEPTQWRSTP
jgi:hypothetical protein